MTTNQDGQIRQIKTNQDDDKSGPDQSDPRAKANVRTGHWGLLRIERFGLQCGKNHPPQVIHS
jgi:hypothetical protein